MTRKALLHLITVMLLSGSLALAQTKPAANQMSGSDSHLVELYLDFLYQYLPLPDRCDYSRAFYEHNVRLSLQTRQEMSWGKRVPEREFRHFVLPIRVNNENLDNSREVFYKELKNRVSGMPMYDAVLEVNHWCHEKVTYRPTDARTSSPLATVRTAYGRCGEESTLLVAALRSVGIPARQVYTPRWAHTDDNHAWVEAWVDGQWYFLGACEPEPVLNLGWFNESASRGMLMHTKVFGAYDGPEEVIQRKPFFTEINVIDHYAPSSDLTIEVKTPAGEPVANARVDFKLYNYAEYFTVASKFTDALGRAKLTAGRGDMMVWVEKGGDIALKKVSFGAKPVETVILSSESLPKVLDETLTPPSISGSLPPVSEEMRRVNNERLAYEDSIRQAYEATMIDESRGNYAIIQQFIEQANNKEMAQKLLSVLTKKDLRDISLEVLQDSETTETNQSEIYCKYVLNPRVELEWLTPYKHFLREQLAVLRSPQELIDWTLSNVKLVTDQNPQRLRMQPMSVYRERQTDELGRDIFFVAAARSLGWPARINEINGKLQYYTDDHWVDVLWHDQASPIATAPQGTLQLRYIPSKYISDPKYYAHFTISRIVDGKTSLLTFDEEATWSRDFAKGITLDEGRYLLTTGTRMASGAILTHSEVFEIKRGETTTVQLTMRESIEGVQVIGSFNAENLYYDLATQTTKSLISTTGRGYYILGLIAPNHEPSNHTLRDIAIYKSALEEWGQSVVLLFESQDAATRFVDEGFDLPAQVVWGIDSEGAILKEIREEMKLTSSSLPIFLICDTFNRVVYIQQGYTINIGEHLVKVLKQL